MEFFLLLFMIIIIIIMSTTSAGITTGYSLIKRQLTKNNSNYFKIAVVTEWSLTKPLWINTSSLRNVEKKWIPVRPKAA